MMITSSTLALVCLMCLLPVPQAVLHASAAEYFVSPTGSDERDGRTVSGAFGTIQRGVNALNAGDTLTIAPGEYRETVFRENLGRTEAPTTIRAAIPGTVLLRGDVPAPDFEPVDGYRFVYVADFDKPAQVVNEVDTRTVMEQAPSIAHLEFTPGACYYDAQRKKLYIATTDLQPPSAHHYTVGVTPEFGLYIQNPVHVVVDGIAATGFNTAESVSWYPGGGGVYGIMLGHANNSTVRRCTAYLNGGGIAVDTRKDDAGHNAIEYCEAFGNDSRYTGEGGNIITFGANHNIIRECIAYSSANHGFRHYGASVRGPAIIRDSIAWGNGHSDMFIKGGKAGEVGLVERSIALGAFHVKNVKRSLIGSENKYRDSYTRDNIVYNGRTQSVQDHEFADPANLDFRLQATSKFRSRYGDELDSGSHPYEPNIHYVKPDGDDSANGLSMRHAWRTLDHAVAQLEAGDTLYLAAGTYSSNGSLGIDGSGEAESLRIRGRGTEPVVIAGDLLITDSRDVTLERLNVTGSVELIGGDGIRFNDCRFAGEDVGLRADGTHNLRITHCLFATNGRAIEAVDTPGLHLSSNIYNNRREPALLLKQADIRYSDYNSYASAASARRVDGRDIPLDAMPALHDAHSIVATPEFTTETDTPQLTNHSTFLGVGRHGKSIGVHHAFRTKDLNFVGPIVHSRTDTTANLEWWSAVPANVQLAWGKTPACENRQTIEARRFASFSLTGLKPGTTYYFQLRSVAPSETSDALLTRSVEGASAPLSFTTQSDAPTPTTYHVAPDGSDETTGVTREDAWRTVAHAAAQVNAGDTVLIHEGTYHETVHVRATGKPDMPITFKAAPGEKVVFDGKDGSIVVGFYADHKNHVRIDGLYFTHYGKSGTSWDGLIALTDCRDVRITRCFLNGYDGVLSTHLVSAFGGEGLHLRNCVVANSMHSLALRGVKQTRIEHSVFLRPLITGWNISGGAVGTHNIFVDSQPYKADAGVHLFELGGFEKHVFTDNAFHLRHPDEEREPFLFYGFGEGLVRMSVTEYNKRTGRDNLVVNPRFTIAAEAAPASTDDDAPEFMGDWVLKQRGLDFSDLFVTHPKLKERGIGLVSEDFADFHFNQKAPADEQ